MLFCSASGDDNVNLAQDRAISFPFHNTDTKMSSEQVAIQSQKCLAILSIVFLPRQLLTKAYFVIASKFTDSNGNIPGLVSAISIISYLFVSWLIIEITRKILNHYIYIKYESSTDKIKIYRLFNRVIICIPVIFCICSGSYIFFKSIALRSDMAIWDGVTFDQNLYDEFNQYYYTDIQLIFLGILVWLLFFFMIWCIISTLKSAIFANTYPKTGEIFSKMKKDLLVLSKVMLALAAVGLIVLAALSFAGVLFPSSSNSGSSSSNGAISNKMLSNLLGALAILAALALLFGLLALIFGLPHFSLPGFARSASSKNHEKEEEDGGL